MNEHRIELVDLHHHIIPDVYREGLSKLGITHSGGKSIDPWNVDMSLSLMQRLNIKTAFMSVSEPALREVVWDHSDIAKNLARQVNEQMAAIKKQFPDRFGAFALLPMPDVQASIEEAKFVFEELGLDGVGLLSNYDAEYLGNSKFDELLDILEKYKAVIYVHPSSPQEIITRPQYVPIDYIEEFTFNTTRAATNLIYGGTMERCPNLQFIFSHMGGTLPYLHWRIENAFPSTEGIRAIMPVSDEVKQRWASVKNNIAFYLKRMWFDTALNVDPAVIRLAESIAPNHTVFGTDSFFAPQPVIDRFIPGLKEGLSGEEFQNIAYKNAQALFPDRWR